jgi:hypothetical protein
MFKSEIPITAVMGIVSGDSKKVYFRGLALSLHLRTPPELRHAGLNMTVDCKYQVGKKHCSSQNPITVLFSFGPVATHLDSIQLDSRSIMSAVVVGGPATVLPMPYQPGFR